MPTPKHQKKEPVPIPHRMTAAEYYTLMGLKPSKDERIAMLQKLDTPDVWVTFHWLVPYGSGFRAHSIVGTVKDPAGSTIEIWVKSKPDKSETKVHGISQGDIVSVPLECITAVTEPMEDLYPQGLPDGF